jgi:hypothetical protein
LRLGHDFQRSKGSLLLRGAGFIARPKLRAQKKPSPPTDSRL